VTSAINSPRLEKNIGYANVPVEHSDLGTELEVLHPGGPRTAVVVRKPFIDPGKQIPKK
jgi:aminomethyltransferase